MSIVIIPNELRDAINAEIDRAIGGRPLKASERQNIYSFMLDHYDQTGVVPSIELRKKTELQAERIARDARTGEIGGLD